MKSQKDIEEVVTAPIIGTIPKGSSKNEFAIEKTSRSPVSEAFRILRTNIDFLLAGTNKEMGR